MTSSKTMLCKLGATGPNIWNVIDDGIVYYSTKFYGIQIRGFWDTSFCGLQWRHQKFKLTTFWTKFWHNLNNPILKNLCKFQVDIPINAKSTAVQSFENLHTLILRQPWWWAWEHPQPIFPYNIIENSPTSFARNSVFVGPNDFEFGTETRFMRL